MKKPSTTCFCDICDKIFSGNDTLLYHIKTQHKELLSSGYKCDICKITLFDSDKEKHMERCYKNLKGAKCHICDKIFSNKQKVLKHVLNQHKTVDKNMRIGDIKMYLKSISPSFNSLVVVLGFLC